MNNIGVVYSLTLEFRLMQTKKAKIERAGIIFYRLTNYNFRVGLIEARL